MNSHPLSYGQGCSSHPIVEKRVLRNESSHGMAQDLAASGVELPPLTTSGRWKSSRMPTRYTER